MFKIGIAQCEGADTLYVIRNVIHSCLDQIRGYRPTAGIIFAADAFDHQAILNEVLSHFPGIDLVGCCTAGEVSSTAGFSDDSVCLMIFCSDEVELCAGYGEQTTTDPEAAVTSAIRMAKTKMAGREQLAIVFVDGFAPKHLDILSVANRQLAENCCIYGGFSSVQRINYDTIATTQFYHNKVLKDAIVILLLAGPITHHFCLCKSWYPIGKQASITETNGPEVNKIGDMSALEFYHYYLGSHNNPAIENPFAVYEDENQFYLRVPTDYDVNTGSISFPVDMPKGAQIQITESNRDRAIEDIQNSVGSMLRGTDHFKPDFALVFSCDIRKNILGTRATEEIESIKQLLPPGIPIIGFYTRGEIAPLGDSSQSMVHHCTLVMLMVQVAAHNRDAKPDYTGYTLPEQHCPTSFAHLKNEIIHHVDFLQRKFDREHYYRESLELNKEVNINIFKRLNQELQEKNLELERLYRDLDREKEKSEALLLNILPKNIAEQLKQKGAVTPEYHPSITIFFSDIVSFTAISGDLSPARLVDELNYLFSSYDRILEKWGLEKLRTIGDSYLCACGLFDADMPHAYNTVMAAIEMQAFMAGHNRQRDGAYGMPWLLRIGINTGPLVAGVIGKKKFAYEIWGDAVNVASRLESTCEPGKINISQATYDMVRQYSELSFEPRGKISVKNRGELEMYFVN